MKTYSCRTVMLVGIALAGLCATTTAQTAADPTSATSSQSNPVTAPLRAQSDSLRALTRPVLRSWIGAQAELARDTATSATVVEGALREALARRLAGQTASEADLAALGMLVYVEAIDRSVVIYDSLVASFKAMSDMMTSVSFAQAELREATAELAGADTSDACDAPRCATVKARLAEVVAAHAAARAELGAAAEALTARLVTVGDLRRQAAMIDAIYPEVFHETKMRRRAFRRVGERIVRLMEMIRRVEPALASSPSANPGAFE